MVFSVLDFAVGIEQMRILLEPTTGEDLVPRYGRSAPDCRAQAQHKVRLAAQQGSQFLGPMLFSQASRHFHHSLSST
jgi:DNA-binding GntR family transcriptional regulator